MVDDKGWRLIQGQLKDAPGTLLRVKYIMSVWRGIKEMFTAVRVGTFLLVVKTDGNDTLCLTPDGTALSIQTNKLLNHTERLVDDQAEK